MVPFAPRPQRGLIRLWTGWPQYVFNPESSCTTHPVCEWQRMVTVNTQTGRHSAHRLRRSDWSSRTSVMSAGGRDLQNRASVPVFLSHTDAAGSLLCRLLITKESKQRRQPGDPYNHSGVCRDARAQIRHINPLQLFFFFFLIIKSCLSSATFFFFLNMLSSCWPYTLFGRNHWLYLRTLLRPIHLHRRLRLVCKQESDPVGEDSLWCIDAPLSVV